MFAKRQLKKFRRYATRELKRTERYIEKYPDRFDAETRKKVDAAAAQLEQAIQNDDVADLNRKLKNYKSAVDHALPIYKISIVREYTEAIVIALILALFIRAYLIQAFKIPSGSMIPTLLVGDHIVVSKCSYGIKLPFVEKKALVFNKPDRGDIVVFKFPRDPSKDFIKRIVGIPGDRLEISQEGVWINGDKLDMSYVDKYDYKDTSRMPIRSNLYLETIGDVQHNVLLDRADMGFMEGIGPVKLTRTVPEGKYFVMGDNRDRSNDSRIWGYVNFNQIKGKALIIYFSWPLNQLTRFGKVVR